MRASAIACSLAMRAFSMVSRAEICACSASVSRNARSRATSVRCSARRISMSRSWSRRAVSLSRSISSAWRSASRLRVRILIIRILFDVVAQLALGLDVLHQAGQALGVEPVRRIEVFEVGLIEIGDGDRLQLKPVLGERLGGGGLEPRDVLAALLVHLLHGHFGGHRTDGGDELCRRAGRAAARVRACAVRASRRQSATASRVGCTRT